jgi:hypothetical protein
MISWLNSNQGFVMCLLTLVYCVATIIIVLYNRKTIEEMKKSREAESRPYVFAYLDKDPRDVCFYFRIKNYGKTGAKLDKVSIVPELKLWEEPISEYFLKDVILAPTQMLEFMLVEEKDETLKKNYSVSLQYSPVDDRTKQYSDEYTLTVQYAPQMGYTEHEQNALTNEENALKNISNHLDSIRRKL